MSVKPITPQEAKDNFITTIPDIVIETINTMLSEKGTKSEITLKQQDIIRRVIDTGKIPDFKIEWLDFEDLYRKVGWSVEYDKPGYNESYPATYKFKSSKSNTNNNVTIY